MNNDITILLPLKDRTSYTKRLMSFLDEQECPFCILIADGGKDEEIQRHLENKDNYSNLNYSYIRYEYDASLEKFYKKMKDAVSRIETKYVSLQDNDDYFNIDGMIKSSQIIDREDYFSARGAVIHNPGGYNMYEKYSNPITGQTAAERVIDQSKHFHSNWHNVMYSKILKATWSLLEIAQPSNFRFVEQTNCYVPIAYGNGHRGDFDWMIHNAGERIQTESGSLQNHFPAQEVWINSGHWLENFNKMTEIVGCLISFYDKIPIDEGLKIFRDSYHFKLPHLKDLLNNRINQAYGLGYNYNRIDKMFKVIEECQV